MNKNESDQNLLEKAFNDFAAEVKRPKMPKEISQTVTQWVPVESWEKYDALQKQSGRKFGKSLRLITIQAIDYFYEKVFSDNKAS